MARCLILLLAALAFAGLMPLAAAGSSEEREHRRQLNAVQQQIQNVQQAINNRRGEHRRQQRSLQQTEEAVAAAHRQIARLEQREAQLTGELEELAEREAELFAAIAAQRERIGRDIASAYRLGREEPLKLLLNLEDPHELSRALKYYDYFLQARQQRIDQFQGTLGELDAVRAAIAERHRDLAEQQAQVASEEARLRDQLVRRQQVLEELQADLEQQGGELAGLQQQQDELGRLIRTLQEAITRLSPSEEQQPFAQRRGKLDWPAEGELHHRFGSRRSASLNWDGWLIGAEEGSPVRAVHGGRVIFSDYLRGHGLLVIVDHGSEYLSLYAHNQVLLKDIGDWVRAGEVLARVGNSGGLEQASLYFELRHRGRPTNPAPWFRPSS